MKTSERALRGSHTGFSNVRLFTGFLERNSRRKKPKTSLRAVTTRLTTPLVELLLDGFSLLIRDDAPAIIVTTFHELGDALVSQHRDAAQGESHKEN